MKETECAEHKRELNELTVELGGKVNKKSPSQILGWALSLKDLQND